MPRHLLHRGQVDAQVQQISDPGPAQVVRCRGLDLAFAATLLTSLMFFRFPDELELPNGEWLYEYELLGLPHVEASVRFRVVPPRDASKDVDRVAASAQDQIDHVSEVGAEPPKALRETAQEAYELKHRVDRAREPLIYASSQLLVAASDLRSSRNTCRT